MVQFEPAEGISFEEALELIERTTLPDSSARGDTGGAEVLRIDHDMDSADPFLDKVDEVLLFWYLFLLILLCAYTVEQTLSSDTVCCL